MIQTPNPPILYSFSTKDHLAASLVSFIEVAQKNAIDKKGKFTIALSGGSLPSTLRDLVGNDKIKWNLWQVFYVDERIVPLDDDNSNHKACVDALFSKVPIPKSNIHTIDPALANDLDELSDAYENYLIQQFAMKDAARFPVFDLILLGMGPDGHTASLFPGHPLLVEKDRWVAWIDDSPKPPSKRITLTLPVINHASRVAFVVAGKEKRETLKAVLESLREGGNDFPASKVRPVYPGQLYWFMDDETSNGIAYPRTPFQGNSLFHS